MSTPTLTLIGLDHAEISLFEAVVDLAGGVELHQWKISQQPEYADVIIVNSDVPRYLRALKEFSPQGDFQPLIVKLSLTRIDLDKTIHLLRPVTYVSLVKLLKELQILLTEQQNPAPVQRRSNPIPAVPTIDPVSKNTDLIEEEPEAPEVESDSQDPGQDKSLETSQADPVVETQVIENTSTQELAASTDSNETGSDSEKLDEAETAKTSEIEPATTLPDVSKKEIPSEEHLDETPDLDSEPQRSIEKDKRPPDEKIENEVSSPAELKSVELKETDESREPIQSIEPTFEPTNVQASDSTQPDDDDGINRIELQLETDTFDEPATDELILSTASKIPALDVLIETAELNDQKISAALENSQEESLPKGDDGLRESIKKTAGNTTSSDDSSPNSTGLWLAEIFNPSLKKPTVNRKNFVQTTQAQIDEPAIDLDEIIRPAKRFYPETRLLGLLHSIIASGTNYRITHSKFPDITIYPATNWFNSTIELNTSELFHIPVSEFVTHELGRHKTEKPTDTPSARDLWTLIYSATLFGSEGRLLQGSNAHAAIKLRQIPDFSKIPGSDEHQRIAKHLCDYPANLSQLATVTQTSIKTVINFTNACQEIGLVEQKNSASRNDSNASPQPETEPKGLFRRIRSKLFKLNPDNKARKHHVR